MPFPPTSNNVANTDPWTGRIFRRQSVLPYVGPSPKSARDHHYQSQYHYQRQQQQQWQRQRRIVHSFHFTVHDFIKSTILVSISFLLIPSQYSPMDPSTFSPHRNQHQHSQHHNSSASLHTQYTSSSLPPSLHRTSIARFILNTLHSIPFSKLLHYYASPIQYTNDQQYRHIQWKSSSPSPPSQSKQSLFT